MREFLHFRALVFLGESFLDSAVYQYAHRYFSDSLGGFEAVLCVQLSQWEAKRADLLATFDTLILVTDLLDFKISSSKIQCFYLAPNKPLEVQINNTAIRPQRTFLYPINMDSQSVALLLKPHLEKLGLRLSKLPYYQLFEPMIIEGGSRETLEKLDKILYEFFGNKIILSNHLAKTVIERLQREHKYITTAESCTGGLLASFLTRESGASAVFNGGVISYANIIKESWLKVSRENLETFGAVSSEVVSQMLKGALHLSGADIAIATSGVAGPLGGSATKPVGTVYVGARSRLGAEIVECVRFYGDRIFIQEQATIYAYILALRILD